MGRLRCSSAATTRTRKLKRAEILDAFGWEHVDLGGIEQSRYLDALAMIWITHAMRSGGGGHAFKLLRK